MRFLDTNVIVRYLTWDLPHQAQRSRDLLVSIEQDNENVVISSIVVFEAVFVTHRSYGVPMPEIRDALQPLLLIPSVQLEDKPIYVRAFDLCIDLDIPFADAFNAAFMEANGINEIYSWDRHFDRIEGITRIEPGASASTR